MKTPISILLLAGTLLAGTTAALPLHAPAATGDERASFRPWYWNVDEAGLAIGGFDPVAYHLLDRAERGSPELEVERDGIRYRFSSSEHAEIFAAEPETFLPAFGGWCAYSLGLDPDTVPSIQQRVRVDPASFLVTDEGELLLFARGPGWDGRSRWTAGDPAVLLERARTFWASRVALGESIGALPAGMSPDAPMETAQFAFAIGSWDSDYRVRSGPDTEAVSRLQGRWDFRFGWQGYAIYDDWVQLGAPPNTSGPAIRSYDPWTRKWIMHYIPINAPMSAVWSMTGEFDENGELRGELSLVDGAGRPFLQRIYFRDITENHFTWSCDRSYDDGATWIVDFGVGSNTRIQSE